MAGYDQTITVRAAFKDEARRFLDFLNRVGRRYVRPVRFKYRYIGRGRFYLGIDGATGGIDAVLQEMILNRGLYCYCCTMPAGRVVADNVVVPLFRQLIEHRFQNPQSRFLRKHVLAKHAQTTFLPTDMRNRHGAAFDALYRRWDLRAIDAKEFVISLDAVLTAFLLEMFGHIRGRRSPKFNVVLSKVAPDLPMDNEVRTLFQRAHDLSRLSLHRLDDRATQEELAVLSARLWNYFQYIDDWADSQKERTVVLRRKRYRRIKYGDEILPAEIEADFTKDHPGGYAAHAATHPCGDCGVRKGQFHVDGCDLEVCPRCGGQYLGCDCKVTVREILARTRKAPPPSGPAAGSRRP